MAELSEERIVSPKRPRLKRLFLISAGVGLGLGVGIVATVASVAWFNSRPIPTHDWTQLEIKGAGLRAKLKTDWDGAVRYQLVVTPRSDELKSAFDNAVRTHRDSISFTILLYDKDGFQVCKKDVKPTPSADAENHFDTLRARDSFFSFECERSDYKKADHWSLSYVFPTPTADTPAANTSQSQPEKSVKPVIKIASGKPMEGDDTLTGFDFISGHLETLSGRTFVVYREGETGTASMWNAQGQLGSQPEIHFSCNSLGECLIKNTTNNQVVHAKLRP